MTSHVIVVGADKGGVGKTTVSRTLLSYLKSKNIEYRAFDTESPKGVLKRFHSNETEIVNMRNSAGMMEVFDKLSKSPVTLIDVRAGLLSDLLGILAKIGLLEAVTAGAMQLTLFHILGASIASFREIHETKLVLSEGSKHFLVMNHINDSAFFDWNAEAQEALKVGDGRIDIPQLDPGAAERIEAASLPFQDFIEDKTNSSFTLRGLTRGWLKEVFSQYDKMLTF